MAVAESILFQINSINYTDGIFTIYKPELGYSGFLTTLRLTINLNSITEANFPYIPDDTPPDVLQQILEEVALNTPFKEIILFQKKGNGAWIERAPIRIFNKEPYYDVNLMRFFSDANTIDVAEDLSLGIQVKTGNVLTPADTILVWGSAVAEKKNNGNEELNNRISLLEALLGIFGAPSAALPGSNGLVPAPPVGGGNFLLRGDRSWQNPNFFAALNLPQTFTANQTFSGLMSVGLDKDLVPQSFSLTDTRTINSLQVLNTAHAVATIASNPAATFVFSNNDFDISPNSNVPVSQLCLGANYRIKNYATGIFTNIQGLRLTALNLGAGNVATLDGASFNARNDSANTTVTHLNGGNFTAALNNIAATVTNLTSGSFTVSAAAASFASTVRGILIKASSSNTTPAVNCIGLDVESITGTATNKLAVRTGAGRVIFGDTTAASSTTAAAVTAHSLGIATTIYAAGITLPSLPTSPTGLAAGSLWRNGNVINIA